MLDRVMCICLCVLNIGAAALVALCGFFVELDGGVRYWSLLALVVGVVNYWLAFTPPEQDSHP